MKLDKYLVDEKSLKDFGFKFKNNVWTFSKDLDSMKVVISIDKDYQDMNADVFDGDEKFLPFYQQQKSEYAANIAKDVLSLEDEILAKCFKENDVKEELYKWCQTKWPDMDINTWKNFTGYLAMKDHKTQKWFGIFMPVKLCALDKTQFKSDQRVWVLDIKLNDEVQSTIDHKHFFPAFHMGKKNWISVKLDNTINLDVVKELIKESYDNVTN